MRIRIRTKKHMGKVRLHVSYHVIKRNILTLFCTIMVFACCFFTHNSNVKLAAFMAFTFLGIGAYLRRVNDDVRISYLVGLLFPLALLVINLLNAGNFNNAIRGAYSGVFFLCLPTILFYDIPFEKVFNFVMQIVIILVLGCIALDFLGIVNIFTNPLLLFMYKNKELQVATKGAQYITHWKVYLQADALLIIYACSCFKEEKYFWLILCGLTMWFSGSMANPIAFILCVGAMWIESTGRLRLARAFIGFGIIIMIFYTIVPFLLTSQDMTIRSSALRSYADIFRNPVALLFGQGYGSEIVVSARKGISTTTEWSFYEMIRWYGLIGFSFFILVLAFPIRKLLKSNRRWMVYATIGYLLIAFTNPLLYTTTGMVAYIMLYYEYFMSRRESMAISEDLVSITG